MTEQVETHKVTPRRPSGIRVAIVAIAGIAVLVGAAVTMAASPSPSPSDQVSPGASAPAETTAPTQPSQPGASAPAETAKPGTMGPGMGGKGHGWGPMGGGPMRGGYPRAPITIASINGSSISLKTDDGWSRTITVTDSTQITRAGQKISVGDLKVGDTVQFAQVRNADGTYTITAINVYVPSVVGTVGAVTGSGFTIKDRAGTTWTVAVTDSTTYQSAGQSASRSAIVAGSTVRVSGAQGSNNTITAESVQIAPARVAGELTAKTDTALTIKQVDGTTVTVKVSSTTTYRVPGVQNATLANVTVGMMVIAEGTRAADGSLSATVVAAGAGFHGSPRGGGRGGHGGFGGPGWGPQASPNASGTSS